ncbi:hypothetical protein Q7C36_012193 [Tachysurus vachellii]|uniref:Uncharacterized protein n=1 Tax=Tachysurus vachellii TaxID=175792 RepID=A0AA88SIS4_TACVA|nr:hypothetical protein Q7C36_012193 [Tachysurus vachellii]
MPESSKVVNGGQETEVQKEKDKHDSEESRKEIKQQNSNTEGQEGKEETTGPETEQMETGKENPKVNNDEPEQNTETVGHQSSEESVATDNTDLITADAGFTVVRSKRKSKASSSGPQTRKKELVETEQEKQIVNSREAVMASGSEQRHQHRHRQGGVCYGVGLMVGRGLVWKKIQTQNPCISRSVLSIY